MTSSVCGESSNVAQTPAKCAKKTGCSGSEVLVGSVLRSTCPVFLLQITGPETHVLVPQSLKLLMMLSQLILLLAA